MNEEVQVHYAISKIDLKWDPHGASQHRVKVILATGCGTH